MTRKILAAMMVGGLSFGAASMVPAVAGAVELKSLRGEAGIDETAPKPEVFEVDESGPVTRAYRQQPPLIPHRIDKYEIDLKVNQCLRCHDWPYNVEENAPKISETHYEDREGNRLDKVSGTRWFCTQCHVPQAIARPLVENLFEPAVPGR